MALVGKKTKSFDPPSAAIGRPDAKALQGNALLWLTKTEIVRMVNFSSANQ